MGLDSIYRIKENKETKKTYDSMDYVRKYKNEKSLLDTIHELLEESETKTSDIDQQWVKENEVKENSFATPAPKNEDEQLIEEALAFFQKAKGTNNNVRSDMRRQQLTSIQQLKTTIQSLEELEGGKSR